ncbi:SufB/SufD family protein [Pectinatus sottacetonis]|uniref:SufB/SufD family protein n=1 Tax=Pectinatus sottacetonis TaxID=1002795 RepID=UPI0018C45A40|nr:SufD family Fe-S cluster assembly protein [Pectinatus sottacetonis]
MGTILHANNLPVLTWNRFNVNYKQIQLSDKPDTKTEPVISGVNKNMRLLNSPTFNSCILRDNDKKTTDYITANASFIKSIIVNKNVQIKEPLIIDLTMQQNDKLTCLFDIILEENSSAEIILSMSSEINAVGQYADLIRIKAATGSSLKLTCLQLLGQDFLAFNNITAELDKDSLVKINQIPLGAGAALASVNADLRGYNSAIKIYSNYIGHKKQEIDLNYVARHYGKKSLSEIKMTGLLLGCSKKTARGTIDFHRGCKGAAGSESENVLILSKTAKNKSVPLILCDEDDVAGNHGAAIGTLDDEPMFYLKSRGINEEEARRIFLSSAVSRLKNIVPEKLAAKLDNYNKDVLFNESI